MRALAKIGLVCAGYVGALVIATAVVVVYIAATSGPDRQTYAAMFDFAIASCSWPCSPSPRSLQPVSRSTS